MDRRQFFGLAISGFAVAPWSGAAERASKARKGMQQNDKTLVTLTGTLEWLGIEGGFWVLNASGKTYDLHADSGLLRGFKSGDKVQVRGRVREDLRCIHMRGIIFEPESIKHSNQD